MPVLKIFKGQKGKSGQDGVDGLSSTNIFGHAIDNPLCYLFNKNNLSEVVSGGLSASRSTDASFLNRYDEYEFLPPSESTNLITYSNNFNQWSLTNLSIVSSSDLDPLGNNEAFRFQADADSLLGAQISVNTSRDKFYTISFWIKSVSGAVDGVKVFGDFGFNTDVDVTVTTDYQRVYTIFNPSTDLTLIGIQPECLTGTEFNIFGVQLEEFSVMTDYKSTNGATSTEFNTDFVRLSDEGYFIEQSKQNLVSHSENVNYNQWSVTGATLSQYQDVDPFGERLRFIRFESLNSSEMVITNTSAQGYTNGVEYSFSMFAYTLGGTVNSVVVSIGGGDEVSYPVPGVFGFTRQSIKVVAGDQNEDLVIKVVSENSNAIVAMTGFQVETGEMSSYTKGAYSGGTRSSEIIDLGVYNNIAIDQFSFCMGLSDYTPVDGVDYIFTNNEIGATELSLWIDDSGVNLKSKLETATFAFDNKTRLGVSCNGPTVKFYGDGLLIGTFVFSSALPDVATDFKLFRNQVNLNNFSGNVVDFKWYNKTLSDDEFRFIHGSES